MCSSDAPDYTPLAQASEEAARISAELGNRQLDFAKKQYEESKPLFQRIVDNQIATSEETLRQGRDYYDYMVANQRPVEAALNTEAMAAGSPAMQAQMAARAGADMRTQIGNQYDQAIRAGLRYGVSPTALGRGIRGGGVAAASSVAGAMTQAAERERQQGYAKRLDVAGLYRGLPGASSAAYGASIAAGNSAGQNQMAPGSQYMTGMAQGADTIQQGQGQRLSGLSNILSAQTAMATAPDPLATVAGTALGAWAGGGFKLPSDRRLKMNIEHVGHDERTGLPLYDFEYKHEPGVRYRGVMADEAEVYMPEAVVTGRDGFKRVDYGMLGIHFGEVTHG